jgi:hypothetical protein
LPRHAANQSSWHSFIAPATDTIDASAIADITRFIFFIGSPPIFIIRSPLLRRDKKPPRVYWWLEFYNNLTNCVHYSIYSAHSNLGWMLLHVRWVVKPNGETLAIGCILSPAAGAMQEKN